MPCNYCGANISRAEIENKECTVRLGVLLCSDECAVKFMQEIKESAP